MLYNNQFAKSTTQSPTRLEHSRRWGPSHPHNNNGSGKGYSPPGRVVSGRVFSGEYLAKNHLDARGRATLAADIIEGRAGLGKLTASQIIKICRANAPYVAAARKAPAAAEKLAQTLASATAEEIARQLGERKLWEVLEHATS